MFKYTSILAIALILISHSARAEETRCAWDKALGDFSEIEFKNWIRSEVQKVRLTLDETFRVDYRNTFADLIRDPESFSNEGTEFKFAGVSSGNLPSFDVTPLTRDVLTSLTLPECLYPQDLAERSKDDQDYTRELINMRRSFVINTVSALDKRGMRTERFFVKAVEREVIKAQDKEGFTPILFPYLGPTALNKEYNRCWGEALEDERPVSGKGKKEIFDCTLKNTRLLVFSESLRYYNDVFNLDMDATYDNELKNYSEIAIRNAPATEDAAEEKTPDSATP